MAGDGAGDAAGDVAADDDVAAEGADGDDGVHGGGVRAIVQLLELAGRGLGGKEGAVGRGDEASTDCVEEEGEEGEDLWREEIAGAGAGAVRSTTGVGLDGTRPGGDGGLAGGIVVDAGGAGGGGGDGGVCSCPSRLGAKASQAGSSSTASLSPISPSSVACMLSTTSVRLWSSPIEGSRATPGGAAMTRCTQ